MTIVIRNHLNFTDEELQIIHAALDDAYWSRSDDSGYCGDCTHASKCEDHQSDDQIALGYAELDHAITQQVERGPYGITTPGWYVIGATPSRLYAPERDPSFFVGAGDLIRFEPVDAATFDALTAREAAGEPVARRGEAR